MDDFERNARESKRICANEDFSLLLQSGNIAFYEGCEVTQFFLFDKTIKKAINYFTLFAFDEVNQADDKPKFLLSKLKNIDNNYSFGIQQKRISLNDARKAFDDIQKGTLAYDEECAISKNLVLLPKIYVPRLSSNASVFLNALLKPNYWGDNYVIEFFDESKDFFASEENAREKIDIINSTINSISDITIDLSKVYDRIGNILFQFPVTILKTQIYSEKNSVNLRLQARYHPNVSQAKDLHIDMSATYDNVITGFAKTDATSLEPDIILKVGDDNNLTTIVSEKKHNLLLHRSSVNFLKYFNIGGKIGIQYSEPRTVHSREGKTENIELFFNNNFGTRTVHRNDYFGRITNRNLNNEIISNSGDYEVFKDNQHQKALDYIRGKIKRHDNDIKEICLWDPYLTAFDIMETLYFEDTGIPFRCITSYQMAKTLSEDVSSFKSFCQEQKECFENKSNNLRVKLKFLAQHDGYGWKFHDRFLLFVPHDLTDLPTVYSLGTSINSLGKNHHIIQKVTNPREILGNFEELWALLDNGECLVAEFK